MVEWGVCSLARRIPLQSTGIGLSAGAYLAEIGKAPIGKNLSFLKWAFQK
jgi:hypothetical protein